MLYEKRVRSSRRKQEEVWDEYGFMIEHKEKVEKPKIIEQKPNVEELRLKKLKERHQQYNAELVEKRTKRESELKSYISHESPKSKNKSVSKVRPKDFESFIIRQNNSAKKHVEKPPPVDTNFSYLNRRSSEIIKKSSSRSRSQSVYARSIAAPSISYQKLYEDNDLNESKSVASQPRRKFRLTNIEQTENERRLKLEKTASEYTENFNSRPRSKSVTSSRLRALSSPRIEKEKPKQADYDNAEDYNFKQWKPEAMPQYLADLAALLPRNVKAKPVLKAKRKAKN